MKILFLHRDFPAQFQHIATELAKDPRNMVLFITTNTTKQIPGVIKIPYNVQPSNPDSSSPYLKLYEECVIHGQAVANIAIALKQKEIIPDIIYASPWGSAMYMKDIFPDVPLLCYAEWFANADGADIGFNGQIVDEEYRIKLRCNNSHYLIDLYSCDGALSPTQWQKSQFPKEFQDKIKVLHDGIDTDICKPNENATFIIKDKNLELTSKDEIVTYATRGMEPYRGFPQFMLAVEELLTKRPNCHFVIAGMDKAFYGPSLENETFKGLILKKLNLDMKRVHFVGTLEFEEYISLLQISSAHAYLTYPYVLSWSFLEAMSTGCCMIASDTQPVLEVMKDNYNGLLFNFSNVEQLVEKIEYALELKINNPDKIEEIRKNARQTVIDKYALKDLLPQHIEFIKSFCANK